jgi:hypothetical protein
MMKQFAGLDEKKAMEIMKEGHRMDNGHHVIPLPFIGGRQEAAQVLTRKASKAMAKQRFLRQGGEEDRRTSR